MSEARFLEVPPETLAQPPFVTVWKVVETVDDRGRLGGTLGYFSCESVADWFAEGKGWYGGKASVFRITCVRVGDLLLELAGDSYSDKVYVVDLNGEGKRADDDLREKTLAALSDDQLRVLGVSRDDKPK